MGLTYVTVNISAESNAKKYYSAQFLVDTGATDCLVPEMELKKINLKPVGKSVYEHADGKFVEYKFGIGIIEFMGEITAGRILFGPDNAEPLLGVTALESVGILVDTVNKTLKRLPAIPLKHNNRYRRVTK